MKKVLFAIMALSLVACLSFTGCNSDSDDDDDETPIENVGGNGNQDQGDEENQDQDEEEPAGPVILLDENWDVEWDNGREIPAESLVTATANSKIKFTITAQTDDVYQLIKMQDVWEGSVTILKSGTLENAVIGGEANDAIDPNSIPGTFTYKPSAAELAKIKVNGIKVMGHGMKVSKIELINN